MHRLSSRPRFLSFMASAPPCWLPPALARRVFPPKEPPNPPFRHVYRNMASSIEVKARDAQFPRYPFHGVVPMDIFPKSSHRDGSANENSAVTQGMKSMEMGSTTGEFVACYGEVIDGKPDTCGKTVDSACGEGTVDSDDEEFECWDVLRARYPFDRVVPLDVFPKSSHRDGSIYKCRHQWIRDHLIADRSETVFEAMMFTEPSNCFVLNGTCVWHVPGHMLQLLSIKLAHIHGDGGPVALYGYIAMRDNLDPLLNYVVKYSRDDPIIVEQGHLFNVTGLKRGIDFYGDIVIEYDMRIKTSEEEKHDLQLIDGVSMIGGMGLNNCQAFTNRIHGDCGAIDITAACLEHVVEATVEVLISEVQSSFSLSLSCFTSGLKEEIRLFDGAIGEGRALKRSVVAVEIDSWIHLKLKVVPNSSSSIERHCSFYADNHGSSARKINTDFALISVKLTWSTLPKGH